jgi:6-pyruvoyltetrahydropterin/6-carboxytetrahydropterin synthase
MKAVRKIHFCSGHRVLNHESKCANLHGHNYVLWVYAEADSLDRVGRVIDFSVLKDKIGSWIDRFWDHTTLIYKKDWKLVAVKVFLEKNKPVFVCDFNPTAENMAQFLLDIVCPAVLTGTGVRVTKIELYETENCKVEVSK